MNNYTLLILLCSLFSGARAMEDQPCTYSLATSHDVDALVQLINEEGYKEEGIIVPPQRFRKGYFDKAIKHKELYVIKDGSTIVGYKKLFILDDETKKHDLLEHEIRCKGNESKSLMHGNIKLCNDIVTFESAPHKQHEGTNPAYIYNGGDFTKKSYRGRGLNKDLMLTALACIQAQLTATIRANNNDAISMVYGITGSNGAFNAGSPCDRTIPIVKSFIPFAQTLAHDLDKHKKHMVYHERFEAFKPTFEPDSDTFAPRSDEYSIPGAGVVLSYPLIGN